MKRRIIKIDETKCNGCGLCAAACHEGAIGMIDGKARLMREDYCDGLGDCLPACPVDAISFEEREAPAYDHAAVMASKAKKDQNAAADGGEKPGAGASMGGGPLPCGCPGSMAREIRRSEERGSAAGTGADKEGTAGAKKGAAAGAGDEAAAGIEMENARASAAAPVSRLSQWPVQIKLAPVNAPYFDGARLLIAADCTAYAYANFHEEFIRGRITLVGCPKLDEGDYAEKLTEILKQNEIKSVTVARMEVPCCGGIENAVKRALAASGKMIPWQVTTIATDGRIIDEA